MTTTVKITSRSWSPNLRDDLAAIKGEESAPRGGHGLLQLGVQLSGDLAYNGPLTIADQPEDVNGDALAAAVQKAWGDEGGEAWTLAA